MVTFRSENQGNQSFLVYLLDPKEQQDNLSMGMMSNNRLTGILPVAFVQMDQQRRLQFTVSSKVPLKSFFSGIVLRNRLLNVFSTITATLLQAEEYMLDSRMFLLDLDYIFVNVSTGEASLLYLPVLPVTVEPTELRSFFKNIMFSTQFDQTENCDYLATIINFLNRGEAFDLEEFQKILLGLQKAGEARTSSPVAAPAVEPPRQLSGMATSVSGSGSPSPTTVTPPPAVPGTGKETSSPAPAKKKGLFSFSFGKKKDETAKTEVTPKPAKAKKEKAPKNNTKANNQKPVKGGGAPAYPGMAIPGVEPPRPGAAPQPGNPAPVKNQNAQAPVVSTETTAKPVAAVPVTPRPVDTPQTMASPGFGETTLLGGSSGGGGETTLLGVQEDIVVTAVKPKPTLIRMKTGERILIDKPVFRLGKERSYVDYFISDNGAISRSHADIIEQNGQFYIVDHNSTNHTFVNNQMISGSIQVLIENQTEIRLANEVFQFEL